MRDTHGWVGDRPGHMRTEATYHTNERTMEFLAGSSGLFFELGGLGRANPTPNDEDAFPTDPGRTQQCGTQHTLLGAGIPQVVACGVPASNNS